MTYLLEGSVRRSERLVRVSTNLTDGKTGFSQWSQTVDRKLTDIFAFQSEIARTVASAMSVRVATNAPAPGGTRNVKAYEAFLRGRALFNLAKDEASDRAALALYELAIAADPDFAMAHAARSRVLGAIAVQYAKAEELKPLYAASIAAARKAITLAPDLAEGHLALGFIPVHRQARHRRRAALLRPGLPAWASAMPTLSCFTRFTARAPGGRRKRAPRSPEHWRSTRSIRGLFARPARSIMPRGDILTR